MVRSPFLRFYLFGFYLFERFLDTQKTFIPHAPIISVNQAN